MQWVFPLLYHEDTEGGDMTPAEARAALRIMTPAQRLREALKADEVVAITYERPDLDFDVAGDIEDVLEENERLEDEKHELARMHNVLEARIAATLALHFQRFPHGPDKPGFCADCIAPWPCPTVKVLRGE